MGDLSKFIQNSSRRFRPGNLVAPFFILSMSGSSCPSAHLDVKKEDVKPQTSVKQEDPGQLTTKMEVKEEPLSPTKPGTSSTTPSGGKSSKPQQSHKSEKLKERDEKRALKSEKSTEEKLIDGKTKEEIETEERERMQHLVSNFTEDQLDRYEMYRRAAFPKVAIKRIMQGLTGSSVGQNVVIAMSGISKVFAGEVVEEALDYMDQLGETGPLKPKHLREAARRLRSRDVFPRTKKRSVLRR